MKKLLFISFILMLAAACQPEAYTGPLDSPIGNWEGIRSEYYFNGEKVADIDSCETKGISFYKQGLCCIQGVKGAFPFIYNSETQYLQIDSSLWEVSVLTGAEIVMTYLYTIYPADPETPEKPEEPTEPAEPETPTEPVEPTDPTDPEVPTEPEEPEVPEVLPDANGVILPAEFNGRTIESNKNGYYYINDADEIIYCKFKGKREADGQLYIQFWYDQHTDYFIPLVVQPTKK